MEEQTTEQRTQAVIDFNKMLDQLPMIIPQLTEEQKIELADTIEARRIELGF